VLVLSTTDRPCDQDASRVPNGAPCFAILSNHLEWRSRVIRASEFALRTLRVTVIQVDGDGQPSSAVISRSCGLSMDSIRSSQMVVGSRFLTTIITLPYRGSDQPPGWNPHLSAFSLLASIVRLGYPIRRLPASASATVGDRPVRAPNYREATYHPESGDRDAPITTASSRISLYPWHMYELTVAGRLVDRTCPARSS